MGICWFFLGLSPTFLVAKGLSIEGTLQRTKLSSWVYFSYFDKLAVAVGVAESLELSKRESKLNEWAVEIAACVDEVAIEPSLGSMLVSETAVMCVQVLKENGMR